MRPACERWERWVTASPDSADAERELHLAACADCRDQWTAHLALAGLSEVGAPRLSRDLGPVLGQAVTDLEPAELLSPSQRRMMRLYWLLATFAAGLVLAQLDAGSTGWILFWTFAATLGLAGLPALLLLRRRLSWGLLDLVVWTLR